MRDRIIIVHPSRLKETAAWVVENLEPHEYPGIDHWPLDKQRSKLEHYTKNEWEELSWFDHFDTSCGSASGNGSIYERTPRRYHLVFEDEQAWLMLRLLQ